MFTFQKYKKRHPVAPPLVLCEPSGHWRVDIDIRATALDNRRLVVGNTMNNKVYIDEVAHRLYMRFSQINEGAKLPDGNRFRLEGFMQAGTFMGLATNAELNRVIEQIHLDVFGQTVAERKEALKGQWQEEAIDYTSYDSPSYQRQPN